MIKALVNEQGDLMTSDGIVGTQHKFPTKEQDVFFNSPISGVKNFPMILRLMDTMISQSVEVVVDKLSLTEKNKGGGEFASSAFTVSTTIAHKQPSAQDFADAITYLAQTYFTMKGVSAGLLEYILENYHQFVNFEVLNDTQIRDELAVDKEITEEDFFINSFINVSDSVCLFEFNPFVFEFWTGYTFQLLPVDQGRYMAFITKMIEIEANNSSKVTTDLQNAERQMLVTRYEQFLFYIMLRYFKTVATPLETILKLGAPKQQG